MREEWSPAIQPAGARTGILMGLCSHMLRVVISDVATGIFL